MTVDAPAPPQRTLPEVHFQSYQVDDYAKAHAFAQQQMARRYPGSVEYLQAEKEMIKQYLAGMSGSAA